MIKRPRLRRVLLSALSILSGVAALRAQAPVGRPLAAEDVYRMRTVSDPQISPDGRWIAYTVTSLDRAADRLRTAIWMVDWEGRQDLQITRGPGSDTTPRWSPDGRWLAFLSARSEDGKVQVWLLDRRGGEASPLTSVKGDIGDFEWSPDGRRLVLAVKDAEEAAAEAAGAKAKAPKPWVIDRHLFKRDIEGYLTGSLRTHLYLFDVERKTLEALTADMDAEDGDPAWSPDGTRIAYAAAYPEKPDRAGTYDLFVVEARAGAAPRKILTIHGPDRQRLAWSPDGRTLAFYHGAELKYQFYNQDRLAAVAVAGGEPLELTAALDRTAWQAEFTADGGALLFLLEDDRRAYLARVPAAAGPVERLTDGREVITEMACGGGRTVVAAATAVSPTELYAYDGGALRPLTAQNKALLAELRLGEVEDVGFRSKDGTEIHGLMVKPPDFEAGRKYPTLLWIHGGPNMQDDAGLQFGLYAPQMERQFLAGRGYVVLAVNYRGSSGRGAAFTRSIFADWGNREVADLLAAVDYAVRRGLADPDRLGVGGWSYGGILTDYLIASDTRFKAAMSGAGSASVFGTYGVDQYIHQYETELGLPWIRRDVWLKISYPFLRADRIRTPTLFMGGEKDFNVPIAGSEQMYQALKSSGVPSQLVIYPGQYHILTRPSFIQDRLERWAAWFDKYLRAQK